MFESAEILGVKITTSKEDEILEFIRKEFDKPKSNRSKISIFTPNPEQVSSAVSDHSLKSLLNSATVSLPDGTGLVAASRILGKGIKARVTGVDYGQAFKGHSGVTFRVSKQPVITGFFGGQKGVAIRTAECLKKIVPKMTLGYASDIFDSKEMIHSDIDILFVALGFPKQEKWIMEHKDEIPATVIMAVGGAFDFLSGRIPRAPKLFQSLGLEWFFRLILEPSRFRRQLRIWHFGALLLEALGNRPKKLKE